ncbi:hypothetical protein GW17_00029579 [Ensete ventricosum]|nr:hypothetical protein GW17_00029579 [Ensete ventricosum]RZR83768.1 hypothetical protein BHM03_00010459 [Ensete ventricosum]
MLLLCCGVLCPCFHAKRKEKSEHSVLDRELKSSLYGKILDFSQRLEIAIDVAHALTYLHLYADWQKISSLVNFDSHKEIFQTKL